jgi:hypothetical protein
MCKREESLPTEIKRAWEDGVPIQNLGDIANTLSRVMTSLKKWSVENFKAVTKMTFGSGVWWNGATSFHFMRVWLENVRPERFQKNHQTTSLPFLFRLLLNSNCLRRLCFAPTCCSRRPYSDPSASPAHCLRCPCSADKARPALP